MGEYNDLRNIPGHMHEGLLRWIEHGVPPGDFLKAVLCNDLMEAYGRADHINLVYMQNWVMYLYNNAPIGSYGSEENYEAWRKHHGLRGRHADGEGVPTEPGADQASGEEHLDETPSGGPGSGI